MRVSHPPHHAYPATHSTHPSPRPHSTHTLVSLPPLLGVPTTDTLLFTHPHMPTGTIGQTSRLVAYLPPLPLVALTPRDEPPTRPHPPPHRPPSRHVPPTPPVPLFCPPRSSTARAPRPLRRSAQNPHPSPRDTARTPHSPP